MPGKKNDPDQERQAEALAAAGQARYVLTLYVTGATPRSRRAIENLKKICEEYLKDHYELEVVDIYQQPGFAKEVQIVAAPTLIKELPPPLRKIIGDLSDTEKVLAGLNIRPRP